MLLLIGDIQGCDDALERLLAQAGFSPSRHRLVALGDLVNRGPASLRVLQRLAGMGDAAQCLLGNHDLHLLAVAYGHRSPHRGDTFSDVLQAPQAPRWIDWIRNQPLALTAGAWLCVHAGVPPAWTADQTLSRAREVQALLGGPAPGDFLAQMYGNEPAKWRDDLQGMPRARFIVNALTRMRFCGPQGELEFETKEGPGAAPPGFRPWFEVENRRTANTPVAFGHWSTLGLIAQPRLLALDTGCVWGGRLSAARVDEGRLELISVPCSPARSEGATH